MNVKPKLLDQVRAKIRLKHYSIRPEQAYVDWIRRYILFHGQRHPQEMGKPEVEVSVSPSHGAQCSRFYPESGAERHPALVQGSVGKEHRLTGRCGTGQTSCSPAGRPYCRRGARRAGLPRRGENR